MSSPLLTCEDAQTAFEELQKSREEELRRDLYSAATRYAEMRARWAVMNPEERHDADAVRTRMHDAFIADCEILARAMRQRGEPDAWRDTLGDDRKRIGDFACWLTAFLGLQVR